MEPLFSPSNQLYDQLARRGRHLARFHELNLDVSTEELLSSERAFTYADMYAMLRNYNTILWLTPSEFVIRKGDRRSLHAGIYLKYSCRICCSADGEDIFVLGRSSELLLEICDVVVRLLAASGVHSVIIRLGGSIDRASINAPTLAYLMEQCQSLKLLSLISLEMDEDHCRVLGGYSRPDLEIELKYCKITSAGAIALAEVLGRNQGPTKIFLCEIDNLDLANGLGGNSRLKSLRQSISSNLDVGNQGFLAITGALRENKGLVDLDIWQDEFRFNDERWGAICDSLKAHPTLEVLNLSHGAFTDQTIGPAVLNSRIEALLNMMKVNKSIHTIRLDDRYSEHELFRGSVIPYLDTNRFRPRVRAIQKTHPIAYRAKVLGRALLATRTDANRFWIILSGNVEVAFPSTKTLKCNHSPTFHSRQRVFVRYTHLFHSSGFGLLGFKKHP